MPKRKKEESQKKQSERFLRAVQELVAAGELSPTEAEKRLEKIVRAARLSDQGNGDPQESGGKTNG